MQVDYQQFLKDGYLILREVVPPAMLDQLRASYETLVDRKRKFWSDERGPEDPPGGVWQTARQPRLVHFQELIDANTADTVEFCLHENTMGACKQLMGVDVAANSGMFMMCSPPDKDFGPATWHRDIHPIDQAPLRGLQMDLLENRPGYLQWNIPLYDDDVLWVVPGSHRRGNTEEENAQLTEDSSVPLPNSIPVELKAGDGVVYTNTILHWGSNYSTKLRRTVHLGYRSYGGPIFPYVAVYYRDSSYARFLSEECQRIVENQGDAHARELDLITAIFRSLLDRNETAFHDALSKLHPGEQGRLVTVILLSKLVYKIRFGTHPTREHYGGDWTQDADIGPRFTDEEMNTLWSRFEPLDACLQADEEQFSPGFQSKPMLYYFEEMPVGYSVEDFVTSWQD